MAALQRLGRHVQHGHVIGHEEGVEFRALQRLDEALQMREVEIGVRKGAGKAPRAAMDADRAHEGAEPELSLLHEGLRTQDAAGRSRAL